MNIYVCIKQVPATETKIKINAGASGIDAAGIKWIMSPYDELAVEEALRVKEKNAGSTVTVVSAGPQRVHETIRTALAMGCDNAVWIETPEDIDSFQAAKALAGAIRKESTPVDLVFTGKQAVDDDCAQVSQLLATFLEIPYVTAAVSAEYGASSVTLKRETEGGTLEIIELTKPCLIAAQKGLNEPRFASLPNIMKAKKKEIKAYKLADLGVTDADRKIRLKNFQLPPPKQAGKKIPGDAHTQSKELVRLLREEAKVI
ncbi:MAG: electron transfer flavoprotein subunit beta/FixA family protein [Deltaproteobacteria bacterium]|nr:electron transfer flavoprotein subunit beta/FixA family protein [Deltaproteobacteria bacterium]